MWLNDMFDILDAEGRLEGDEEQIGGFDLVYRDGFLANKHSVLGTYLRCEIPREASLRAADHPRVAPTFPTSPRTEMGGAAR